MSGEGGNDPLTRALAWIEHVGNPLRKEVDGLKRAFWWAAGAIGGAGIILGWLSPYLLKKLGLS